MDWNAEVVEQIETHWRTRLRPRLDGLSDDEYFWEPVEGCWTVSRRGQSSARQSFGSGEFTWDYGDDHDPEPVTTIAWRLAHLTVGLAQGAARRFGAPEADYDTFEFAGTADQALEQLDDQFAAWIHGVRRLGEEGLLRPQGWPPAFADAPMVRLVLYTNVELVHHGAEICLLRDLYSRLGSC
ncbi:DinB family protein [Kribbella jejuensis]|uniref:DinB family protein n=1 Tax=Kribbella jejuensis TaxID=236068 RepID=A0A542ESW2_9ACTN|nr:DinB family protein [Kribbella jejuensis]TQJ18453.1 DinB family protein [Kribbella jejuensis]